MDSEAPFRRYADAGLVSERFRIDDGPVYWGYHVPGERWNGWATPLFTREVVTLIMEWLNSDDGDGRSSAWWEDATLCVRGQGFDQEEDIERITPDDLGLYAFDGWCWLEHDDT